MKLPLSRTVNILVQEAGQELLVYDLLTDQAFCLNETLAAVFNACDGKTTLEDLKRRTKFSDDIILLALDELKNHKLLSDQYDSPLAGMSRREVIKKVGLTTMIALPVVMSIVAPVAAQAASGCSVPTTQPPVGTCQSAGQFIVGCVLSEAACQNIAATTTSCCNRVTGIGYYTDGPYCLIDCTPSGPSQG